VQTKSFSWICREPKKVARSSLSISRQRRRDSGAFDLPLLAQAYEGFSGAEIEQAIVSALYAVFTSGCDLTTALLAAR